MEASRNLTKIRLFGSEGSSTFYIFLRDFKVFVLRFLPIEQNSCVRMNLGRFGVTTVTFFALIEIYFAE